MAKISVSDLEFDDIKKNLKEFLKKQDDFKDYNFEGSGLSVLLDILAFNTHYNSLYDNMMVNESFLDSASNRASVVSRAYELGYTPKSATCSKIVINLEAIPSASTPLDSLPYSITIPEYTAFTSNSLGYAVQFYNTDAIVMPLTDGKYVSSGVTLLSGTPNRYMFRVAGAADSYILPNPNIDTSTLKVSVMENAAMTSTQTNWHKINTFTSLNSTSKAYWLREHRGNLFEIKFGDGILGKALEVGNVIVARYMISSGSIANGVKSLSYGGSNEFADNFSNTITANVSITGIESPAYNGSEPESIESIRFNAPRAFATQNRAVSVEDYKTIASEFPEAKAVSVWGGEDNLPPRFGEVFIAVSQHSAKALSTSQKNEILSLFTGRKGFMKINIVDAEYLKLDISVTAYYDQKETALNSNVIRSKIVDAITKYNEENLQVFDKVFRSSRLTRVIDSADKSILSSRLNIVMRVDSQPAFDVEAQYKYKLINAITPGTIKSNGFYVYNKSGQAEFDNIMYLEDLDGVIQMYCYDLNGNKVVVNSNTGSVNYSNGEIVINALEIVAINTGGYLSLSMTPLHSDVVSALTKVVVIDSISVNVINDKTASGDIRGGLNFTF